MQEKIVQLYRAKVESVSYEKALKRVCPHSRLTWVEPRPGVFDKEGSFISNTPKTLFYHEEFKPASFPKKLLQELHVFTDQGGAHFLFSGEGCDLLLFSTNEKDPLFVDLSGEEIEQFEVIPQSERRMLIGRVKTEDHPPIESVCFVDRCSSKPIAWMLKKGGTRDE